MIKKITHLTLVIFIYSCSLNPDTGPQNDTNSNHVYSISWNGPGTPYYNICSVSCDCLDNYQDQYFSLGPTSKGNSSFTWVPSNSSDLPYLFLYTIDGMTSERQFIAILTPSAQSQSLTAGLTAVGDFAIFTNDSKHILVCWNYNIIDYNVKFIVYGYDNNNNIIDTEIQSPGAFCQEVATGTGGYYSLWITILGYSYFLDSGYATSTSGSSGMKSLANSNKK
ncbi:MAG: hypothetical protein ABSC11_12800 [Smithella sp.]|jgi:hypothetical protein